MIGRPLGMAGVLWLLLTPLGLAQTTPESPTPSDSLPSSAIDTALASDSILAIDTALGSDYRASTFHRLFLGGGYRDLWATRVRVEVLQLRTFAGGLRPIKRGNLTRSLRFLGADGREYVLRAADKMAAYTVAPELRGTMVERVIQDQLSASHPFSTAVADRLESALGLPPLHPKLVMLPDDPALGEFRKEFAGMIGYIQERPEEGADRSAGFAGFNRVIGTDALMRRRRERPKEQVDYRRFLTARVLDLLLGDWDRHRDQWRWGRTHSDSAWQPVPRDHDWAFGRYNGLVLAYLRHGPLPHLVRFDSGRLPVAGLTWFGRDLDRELLPRLEWATWDSVSNEIQIQLTDSVINSAVAELPSGVPDARRSWLARMLRNRREYLPDAVRRFYLLLAREADLHATDAAERISIVGMEDGAVLVQISGKAVGTRLSRRFDPAETKEVRIYAHRGADTVVTEGERGRIRVRVIGGGGKDVVLSQDGPKVDFYQGGEKWRPAPKEGDHPPPRDWGSRTFTLPHLSAATETGLVFGVNLTHIDYGFRKVPFAARTSVRAVFGTASERPALQISSLVQTANPKLRFVLDATAGGVEVLRFYDLGNRSIESDDRRFHRVRAWDITMTTAAELAPGGGLLLGIGPRLRFLASELEPGRLITAVQPYGSDAFGEIGMRAYARWDTRDIPANPRHGLLLDVGGDIVPGVWDAERSFGSAQATASTYFSFGGKRSPTVALRAGGRKVWGRHPYFEASRIGGEGTLRGYSDGRFLGDAALFGSLELRVPVAPVKLLVPGYFGVIGFADAGRVYLNGESSKDWHEAFGGGLWFAFLSRNNVAVITVAKSPERTIVNLGGGMAF